MKLIWLGHSGFRLEVGNQVLLIDPWMTGNPVFPQARQAEATRGATHILLTHAHGDHVGDALSVSVAEGAPIAGIYDLVGRWEESEGVSTIGFNKGGTVMLGDVAVTMVHATHSSSLNGEGGSGSEAGFMIAHGGRTIYVSGDTDVMADMAIFEALHRPEIGVLCIGGHFTMDQTRAAYAANAFFNFKTIVPCHYRTFPVLAQDAEELKRLWSRGDVIEPEVLVPIDL